MTDHEFDEIDKAVASATGGNNTPRSTSVPVREEVPVVRERSQPPAVRRSSGRVMDIMRPSSKPAPAVTPSLQPTDNTQPQEVSPVVASLTPVESVPVVEEDLTPEVPTTPFLPDAQERIEKRPLNAASFAEPVPVVEAPVEVPVAEPTPEVETPVEPASTPVIPEVTPSVVPAEPEQPTSDATSTIFDTEQSHAPVTPTKKKTSRLMIILWLLGLVIFGAAVGWSVFTFVLPLLG